MYINDSRCKRKQEMFLLTKVRKKPYKVKRQKRTKTNKKQHLTTRALGLAPEPVRTDFAKKIDEGNICSRKTLDASFFAT